MFVNGLTGLNPQTISDEILNKALQNYNNQPKDDCTVVCARVFPRI